MPMRYFKSLSIVLVTRTSRPGHTTNMAPTQCARLITWHGLTLSLLHSVTMGEDFLLLYWRVRSWKALWKINAPGKMKINLWRAVQDCLPTGFQLRRRHIDSNDGYVFCNRDDTLEHVFLSCPFASSVWQEIKQRYDIKLKRRGIMHLRNWIFDFLEQNSSFQHSPYSNFLAYQGSKEQCKKWD